MFCAAAVGPSQGTAMSSPHSSSLSPSDFVAGDLHALALHMRDCAQAHGPMSSATRGLEWMHTMAAGRIVTIAFSAVVLGLGVVALA